MSEITIQSIWLAFGLIVLVASADVFIQGCVKLSARFKLNPLFVGLILVALGTSAPEAGVGIIAALRGQKGIALGNVVGSNIANIGLVIGLCALLFPLRVKESVLKQEAPIMFVSSLLLLAACLDGKISRVDGVFFLLFFILFCVVSFRAAKKVGADSEVDGFEFKKWIKKMSSPGLIVLVTFLSLCGIILGADCMVRGGAELAKIFGISPWIIGITVFAVGTSLPELAASVTASLKKIPSISVGNIVGSNIFNILFVIGVVSLIRPIEVSPSVARFELPALALFSLLLVFAMRTKYVITRREGFMFLAGYGTFLFFLFKR